MNPILIALAKPLLALVAGSAVFMTKSSVQLQNAEAAFELKRAEIEQIAQKPVPKIDEFQIAPKPEDVKEQPED